MPHLKLTLDVPITIAAAYENASDDEQRRVQEALRQELNNLEVLKTHTKTVEEDPRPQEGSHKTLHPEVLKMIGIASEHAEIQMEDAKDEYYDYLMKKHR